jgi:hypothetical protein
LNYGLSVMQDPHALQLKRFVTRLGLCTHTHTHTHTRTLSLSLSPAVCLSLSLSSPCSISLCGVRLKARASDRERERETEEQSTVCVHVHLHARVWACMHLSRKHRGRRGCGRACPLSCILSLPSVYERDMSTSSHHPPSHHPASCAENLACACTGGSATV